ncbi:MAG TPA: hypothetical protein VGN00_29255 [Puia sp.]|jgi:hypothetical protein
MLLSAYSGLIGHLPYLDQAFETKKETWDREHYQSFKDFDSFLQKAFTTSDTVIFSRADLFDKVNEDIRAAIFSIIFWGYPRNMRGNSFKSILSALPDIEKMLSGNRELDTAGFAGICEKLNGKGMGLSTLSKFLYFFGFRLEGYKCLILDSRIIDVLNANTFAELKMNETITEWNKEDYYPRYLKMMEDIAQKNDYSVDQLELFLFQFGKNLKSVNS